MCVSVHGCAAFQVTCLLNASMQSFLASYVLQTLLPEECAFKYADEAFGVGAPTYLQEPDSRERFVVPGLQLRIPEMVDGVFIQSASCIAFYSWKW